MNQFLANIISTLMVTKLLLYLFIQKLWNWLTTPNPSKSVYDYAIKHGYHCKDFIITTKDGYRLLVHRLRKHSIERKPIPILLQHGFLMSAGVWVTSGEKSLAFLLLEQGYEVWLGNNRGIRINSQTTPLCRKEHSLFIGIQEISGHVSFNTKDLDYWNWSLHEIAHFDFPALISFVKEQSQVEQLHYIGHSQGSAQVFIALSSHSDAHQLEKSLASFTALAPATAIGSLAKKWPLRDMIHTAKNIQWFHSIFGKTNLLPIMHIMEEYLPTTLYSFLAYEFFAFLFDSSDRLWDPQFKEAYFQFTPVPTSTRNVLHWFHIALNGLSPLTGEYKTSKSKYNPCEYKTSESKYNPCEYKTSEYKATYNLHVIQNVPILLLYGEEDSLINVKKTMEQLKNHPNVKNICIRGYKHLDVLWATDLEHSILKPTLDHIDFNQ